MDICVACGSLIRSGDTKWPDGRWVCAKCMPAVVSTPQHLAWVNGRVLPILAKHGIDDIPKNVPIDIVTTAELARIQNRKEIYLTQLGLTRTQYTIGPFGKTMKHNIYVIDGLHKIVFAGTLAHEYLHVWQYEHDIHLPPLYTEGFCNMGAYLVYRNIANELAHKLYTNMRDGNDPIYSEGFRQVKAIFDGEGRKSMIATMNILKSKYQDTI